MTSPRQYRSQIRSAAEALLRAFGKTPPDFAVILGSGLGSFADCIEEAETLPYSSVPGFPKPSVPGHGGGCRFGHIGGRKVLAFMGRFHHYEGHSPAVATLQVRAAAALKIRNLVVTNAAGGIRRTLQPGSLMSICDHLNLIGQNPLVGPNLDEAGPRFLDMTAAYDGDFRRHLSAVARRMKIRLSSGVYAAVPGPSYETPAEVRMLARLGADAVGMSTVPEVIVGRHQGMRVLGISCITNHASGVEGSKAAPITHAEVLDVTRKAEKRFAALLAEWIRTVPLAGQRVSNIQR